MLHYTHCGRVGLQRRGPARHAVGASSPAVPCHGGGPAATICGPIGSDATAPPADDRWKGRMLAARQPAKTEISTRQTPSRRRRRPAPTAGHACQSAGAGGRPASSPAPGSGVFYKPESEVKRVSPPDLGPPSLCVARIERLGRGERSLPPVTHGAVRPAGQGQDGRPVPRTDRVTPSSPRGSSGWYAWSRSGRTRRRRAAAAAWPSPRPSQS